LIVFYPGKGISDSILIIFSYGGQQTILGAKGKSGD